jgi:hypothetical protein
MAADLIADPNLISTLLDQGGNASMLALALLVGGPRVSAIVSKVTKNGAGKKNGNGVSGHDLVEVVTKMADHYGGVRTDIAKQTGQLDDIKTELREINTGFRDLALSINHLARTGE